MPNSGTPDDPPFNQDATDDERSSQLIPKLLIAPIAILIATMMIGLPVLRILTADTDDEAVRNQTASDVRGQVAVLFASAVLESRSPTIAARYAEEGVHAEMRNIIVNLQRSDGAVLQDAVATTMRVGCRDAQPEQECFVARLGRSGEDAIVEMAFTVGIVNGVARVVSIEPPARVLLGRYGRRR
jgi:hypothetical protein